MAAITANVQRAQRGMDPRKVLSVPLAGATAMSGAHTVYENCPVASDVNVTGGYGRQVADSVTWASGDAFLGIALEKVVVDATMTADGLATVSVARDGVWAFPIGSITIADIGKAVYLTSDTVATVTSTNAIWIGTLVQVDATYAWVDIEPAAGRLVSAAA